MTRIHWRGSLRVSDLAKIVQEVMDAGHGSDPVLLVATPGETAGWLGAIERDEAADTLDLRTMENVAERADR